MWRRRILCLRLALSHNQLAVLHFNSTNVVGQFQAVALLGQLLLQRIVHQRNRNVEIADLEFGGIESRIAVFGSKMPGERYPNIFSADLGEELAVRDVSIETNLVILNVGLAGGNSSVGRERGR